jgi:hypothetical protein
MTYTDTVCGWTYLLVHVYVCDCVHVYVCDCVYVYVCVYVRIRLHALWHARVTDLQTHASMNVHYVRVYAVWLLACTEQIHGMVE